MATVRAGEILRDAFGVVLGHPLAYLRTVGVFVLAAAAVSVGLDLLAPGLMPDPAQLAAEPDPAAAAGAAVRALLVSLAVATVVSALTSLGWAVGVPTTHNISRGQPAPALPGAWRQVAPRLLNYFASMAAAGLAITALLLGGAVLSFLVLPFLTALALAIWIGLRWSLIGPVSLLEQHGFAGNFDRSATLTQGHKVPIFLVYLGLLAIGVTAIAVPAIALEPTSAAGVWVFAAVGLAVQLVLIPVGIAATVRIYEVLTAPGSPGDLSNDL